jgi:hypothetical protein
MLPAIFENAIEAIEWPQTHASDRAFNNIANKYFNGEFMSPATVKNT